MKRSTMYLLLGGVGLYLLYHHSQPRSAQPAHPDTPGGVITDILDYLGLNAPIVADGSNPVIMNVRGT